MGRIDFGRVLLGGLVAGVVIVIGDMIANLWLFVEQNEAIMERIDMVEPGPPQIAFFIGLGLVVGITMIWLYAAIRPRFGPGPGTAACAGLLTWALYFLFPMLMWTAVGVVPVGATVGLAVWGAVELVAAALAGAMLYKEEFGGPGTAMGSPGGRPPTGA